MDFLPGHETINLWLMNYGSIALFFLLALGIIALPVPEETMMVLTGILMAQNHLRIIPTVIAAYAGSMAGITASYLIGRTLGRYFLQRYGKYFGINEKQIDKGHAWFERYGKWTLLIGYFIPGVRHFTGLIAGITKLEFHEFALFAYVGALIWVSTFLSIGYFFNGYWVLIYESVVDNLDEVILAVIVLLICILFYKMNKKQSR